MLNILCVSVRSVFNRIFLPVLGFCLCRISHTYSLIRFRFTGQHAIVCIVAHTTETELKDIEVALNTYRCIWILVCRQKLGTSSHTSKCMGIRITPSQCSPLMLLLVISLFRSNPHTASCCPSLSFILSFYWVYVYVCSTPFQTSAAAFSIKYAGKIACSTWLHLYTLHTTSSIYIYTYV